MAKDEKIDKLLMKVEIMTDEHSEFGKDIRTIRESQIRTEDDLKYHIKRTDILEAQVKPITDFNTSIKSILKLVAAATVIFGCIAAYNKAFAGESINQQLRTIQAEVPCKIKIHSAQRSISHNRKVGGVKNSYHLTNQARDISAPCLSVKALSRITRKHSTTIIYKSHVHIDNRVGRVCLIKKPLHFIYCKLTN